MSPLFDLVPHTGLPDGTTLPRNREIEAESQKSYFFLPQVGFSVSDRYREQNSKVERVSFSVRNRVSEAEIEIEN